MPKYEFKLVEEAAWSFLVSAIVFAGSAFLLTDDATDWRTWAVAAALGAARSGVGAVLAVLTRPKP
jgi:hypothetical protein